MILAAAVAGCDRAPTPAAEAVPALPAQSPTPAPAEPEKEAPDTPPVPRQDPDTQHPAARPPAEPEGGEPAQAVPAVSIPVRHRSGRCGDNIRSVPAREGRLEVTANARGSLRMRLVDYRHNCDPGPRFEAERTGTQIRLTLLEADPDVPQARCICYHDLQVSLDPVPPGNYDLRVETIETRPVNAADGWRDEAVTIDGTVTVR